MASTRSVFLPRETAIGIGRTAKMAVSGGALVDRLVQTEQFADTARAEIGNLVQGLLEPALGDRPRAGEIDIERQRLGYADCVGQLNGAPLGKLRGNDILGKVARRIGSGTVDLGRVLAGKGAAAVGRRAAIGVDNDLAAGQTGIAVGPADDEAAGRIDVELVVRAHPAFGQHFFDIRPDDGPDVLLRQALDMLGGNHDRRGPHRLAAFIFKGYLALGVGASSGCLPAWRASAMSCRILMRKVDRRRHENIGLAAGITEHYALIAGPFVLVAGGIDTHRDVGRLVMNQDIDLGVLPMEPVLLVADLANAATSRLFEHLMGHMIRSAHLAGEHHLVGRGQRFDRNPRIRVGGQISVDDGIGNAVAHLVGMTLRHGLAGE